MEQRVSRVPFLIDFDYIEEESDEDRRGQDSSEDELDIILHGTPKQKRKLSRSLSRGSLELSSSEDDFEKEMERELSETVRLHEEKYAPPKAGTSSSSMEATSGGEPQSLAEQFYDDIYFDSDSDSAEEGEAAKKQKKDKKKKPKERNRIISDDELLYDPNIDDENQRWVDKQRQKYRNQQKRPPGKPDGKKDASKSPAKDDVPSTSSAPAAPAVPKSDAILNCPACLTTLCLDCQRHELYHNQFRAMFVLNCTIIKSERLKYPVPKKSNKKWKRNRGNKRRLDQSVDRTETEEQNDELYFPVQCSVCNTEVGVYDEDEVFHFFNVLTSLA